MGYKKQLHKKKKLGQKKNGLNKVFIQNSGKKKSVRKVFKVLGHLLLSRFMLYFSAMHLHYGDLTDSTCLVKIISQIRPTEIYNLAAQSHVKVS